MLSVRQIYNFPGNLKITCVFQMVWGQIVLKIDYDIVHRNIASLHVY